MDQYRTTSVSATGLVLAHVWTTSGKPDLGHQRVIILCVSGPCVNTLCGPVPDHTNFVMWVVAQVLYLPPSNHTLCPGVAVAAGQTQMADPPQSADWH